MRWVSLYATAGQKIVQAKKLVKSNKKNSIFGSFKLFPSSKLDSWPFLRLQKMEFGQKIFHEIDLFDFTSFFAWTCAYLLGKRLGGGAFYCINRIIQSKAYRGQKGGESDHLGHLSWANPASNAACASKQQGSWIFLSYKLKPLNHMIIKACKSLAKS